MAKCFITSIELPLEDTYILDIAAAYRALRDLRQRLASVERIIQQLGPKDDVEVYDGRKHRTIIRKDRRLVSPTIAMALSAIYPQEKLFITWGEWRSRRLNINDISSGDKEAHSKECINENSSKA